MLKRLSKRARAIGIVLAVVAVFGLALPALAETQQGTKACGVPSTPWGYLGFATYGEERQSKGPGGAGLTLETGLPKYTLSTGNRFGGLNGGHWQIIAPIIHTPSTNPYCSAFGA